MGRVFPALLVASSLCALYFLAVARWQPGREQLPHESFLATAGSLNAPQRVLPAASLSGLVPVDPSHPCPRVYKYKLPDAWLKMRVAPNRGHADPPYPDPWGTYITPGVPGIHATRHKSAPALMERLLDNYGDLCATTDPFQADLFFIPWWRDWFCGGHGKCDYSTKATKEESEMFSYISNYTLTEYGVDFFHRNNGYDHFILAATMAAINLVPKYQKWSLFEWTNVTHFSSVGGSAAFHPFASFAKFETGTDLDKLPWRAQSEPRQYLVNMAWGSTQGGRGALLKQCNAEPELCSSMLTTRREIYNNDSEGNFRTIIQGYSTATFCVQKGQETCTRKGVIDALTLGCIVVLFSSCPIEYVNDFIDMRRVTIQLPWKYVGKGLIQRLQEVPLDQIRDMQLYLAQNAHRLQFSRIDSREDYESLPPAAKHLVGDDAFFTILKVAKRNVDRAAECDAISGHYQPRYRVCCERKNGCDPKSIVEPGVVNLCQGKKAPPCYFPEAQMHELWDPSVHKYMDPIVWDDFLRGPKPYIVGELPPMSWNSTW